MNDHHPGGPQAELLELLEATGPDFAAAVLDAAPVIVLVIDSRGRIVHYNGFMERLCGRALSETRGLSWVDEFLLADERPGIHALFEHTAPAQPVHANVNYIRVRGGAPRLIEWHDRELWRDGELTCVAVGVDITERARAASERAQLAARFELFVNQVDDALFVTPLALDRVLYMSPAFERITGLSCERVYADASVLVELLHPDDQASFVRSFGSVSEGDPEQQIEREYRLLRCREGDAGPELRWIWVRYNLVSAADGADPQIVGTITDITERKRAALAIEASYRRFALVDAAIDEVFLLLNPARDQVLYASTSTARMFGVNPEEVYADLFVLLKCVHPDDYELALAALGQTLSPDYDQLSHEYRVFASDGGVRWIASRVTKLGVDSLMPGALVSVSIDITGRHEAEERLRRLTAQLEARVQDRTFRLEFERRRLGQIIDGMAVYVAILDPDGRIEQLNAKAQRALASLPESLIGRPIDALPGLEMTPCSRMDVLVGLERAQAGMPARFDIEVILTHGRRRVMDVSLSPIFGADRHIDEIVLTSLDVTKSRLSEQRLRESIDELEIKEARLIGAQRLADVGDWDWDIANNSMYWSEQLYRIIGRTPTDTAMSYEGFIAAIHSDDRARVVAALERSIATGETYMIEHRLLRPDGELRTILETGEVTLNPLGQAIRIQGMAQDITRQKSVEAQLRGSLGEMDAMLHEIHHRVKNNLQVVSSLLYLQGHNADESIRAVLDECRTRIRSMALIHEQLYMSGRLSHIEMHEFLAVLGRELGRVYTSEHAPTIVVVGNGLELDIERAVPVALIANELLTNALKYAYPKHAHFDAPQVRVYVSADALIVEDDGVGLPADFHESSPNSLGLRLVRTLTRQLGAQLEFIRAEGTRAQLRLPPVQPTPPGDRSPPSPDVARSKPRI